MTKWKLLIAAWLVAPILLHAEKGFNAQEAARQIDALLVADWKEHGVASNPPASDETFVRRIYLDVAGRIPSRLEVLGFLESTDPAKRAKLIDALLESEGHAQRMFHFWADILRLQTSANGGQGAMTSKPYIEHVKKRLRENQPYDAFVRELLTARGKVWDNPAIGYYMRDLGMPLDNLALTTRIFLGTRLECAQCHNHPFDKWTQMQFYKLAAFTYPLETNFAGITGQPGADEMKRNAESARAAILKNGTEAERTRASQEAAVARFVGRVSENLGDFVRYSKVETVASRQLKLPHDYQYPDAKPNDPVPAATLFGNEAQEGSVDAFADWLTSPDNPRFTTVIANRLWKLVFGLGLIEPVDELFDGTIASNPALMKYLEGLMVACDYDMKAYLRALYLTEAYQRDVTRGEPVAGEFYRFPGPLLRRMSAEQIWDSFVTLVQPTPDLPRRRGIDADMAGRLAYRGKLSDALDLMTAEEIYEGSLKASEAYEAISVRSGKLKEQYAAAQKAKDKELIEKLSNEIRALEFTARSSINDHIVIPAVARLYTAKTGKPAPPPIVAAPPIAGDSMSLKKASEQRPYIDVPGYQQASTIPQEEAAAEEARLAIFREEVGRFAIPDAEVERYLKTRQNQAQEWMRAADLESPAPRGHALRDFGQSDRSMVENANSEAAMPQALVLMNSRLFEQVMSDYTQLTLGLRGITDPAAQAEVVYLTLLARKPSRAEIAAWSKAREAGLDRIDDLVFALINSRQFLFVR